MHVKICLFSINPTDLSSIQDDLVLKKVGHSFATEIGLRHWFVHTCIYKLWRVYVTSVPLDLDTHSSICIIGIMAYADKKF